MPMEDKEMANLKVGLPIEVGGGLDWCCPFELSTESNRKLIGIHGINALQALDLAIKSLRGDIEYWERTKKGRFHFLDDSATRRTAREYTSMVLNASPCRFSALTCLRYNASNRICCDLFIHYSSRKHASVETRGGIIGGSISYLPRSGFVQQAAQGTTRAKKRARVLAAACVRHWIYGRALLSNVTAM